MLQLFKTNQFSVGILFFFYAAILKVGDFLPTVVNKTAPVTGYLHEQLLSRLPEPVLLRFFIGIAIVFIGGFLMSIITVRQRLESEVTLLSGLFFILVMALRLDYVMPSGLTIGAVCLILALQNLLYSPNKVYNAIFLFNTGFFIGLAGLFYWSMWVFVLWAILGGFQLLGARLKETLMILTGFVIPYFFMAFEYFWNGHFSEFSGDLLFQYFDATQIPLMGKNLKEWIATGILSLLLLSALFSYNKNIKKKQVIVRRKINVIYWMIPFIPLVVILQSSAQVYDYALFAIPLSVVMAFQFTRLKSGAAELLHFILVAIAVYLSF